MTDADRKAAAIAKRAEIRNYITNERDTIVRKWACLTEYINTEDKKREQFYVKKAYNDTRVLPDTIDRFLRTLKKSLGKMLREKGGTPHSIVRNMFIYWDATKSGSLNAQDLKNCLTSLGVFITQGQIEEIVKFYDDGAGKNTMKYNSLLKDLLVGEPTLIQKAATERETDEDRAKRFKLMEDKFLKKPRIVEKFLEAVRNAIMKKLTLEGGTPYSHVRHAFLMFDWNYSNALDVDELTKAVKLNMGLTITEEQAQEIIDFYDRKNVGEMDYKIFLEHVCEDMDVFLTYTEETPRTIEQKKKSMAKNPFVIKEFKALPNKTLEMFKRKVKFSLEKKIRYTGGSVKSWVRDAFARWDPTFSGKINDWKYLQGACKSFGFVLTQDEALTIMHAYATDDSGTIEYFRLVEDILADDPHFLADASSVVDFSKTATARAPVGISASIRKFRNSIETFSRHSKGEIDPKDVMYGTFLRVDKSQNHAHTGRVNEESFRKVIKTLNINFTDKEISDLVTWFDSNGTKQLDYNELTRQLFGGDVLTKPLYLPAISLSLAKTPKVELDCTGTIPSGTSLATLTNEKAMKIFKSRAKKMHDKEARKKVIAHEKEVILNKLKIIEQQKNHIHEQQNHKHNIVK